MNATILLLAISAIWVLSEIIMGRLTYSHSDTETASDRHSLRILWLTIIPSVSIGVFLGMRGIGFIPGISRWVFPLGLFLIVAGLIVRWTAVFTLRHYFTSNVRILPEHRLVQSGPYRFIRHPAYSGALLSFLGLGLVFANWLSLLIIFVPVTAAFLYRIRVEEAALREAFGETYRAYCRKTRRLIPGVY